MRSGLNIVQSFEVTWRVDAFARTLFRFEPGTAGYEVSRRNFVLGMLILHGMPETGDEAKHLTDATTNELFLAAREERRLDRLEAEAGAVELTADKWCEVAEAAGIVSLPGVAHG